MQMRGGAWAWPAQTPPLFLPSPAPFPFSLPSQSPIWGQKSPNLAPKFIFFFTKIPILEVSPQKGSGDADFSSFSFVFPLFFYTFPLHFPLFFPHFSLFFPLIFLSFFFPYFSPYFSLIFLLFPSFFFPLLYIYFNHSNHTIFFLPHPKKNIKHPPAKPLLKSG